jgi:hypothetical protein
LAPAIERRQTVDHPDIHVEQALIRLNDALCTWERSTGRQSVLILREQGGYEHRSMSGKPDVPADVTDEQLMGTLRE